MLIFFRGTLSWLWQRCAVAPFVHLGLYQAQSGSAAHLQDRVLLMVGMIPLYCMALGGPD